MTISLQALFICLCICVFTCAIKSLVLLCFNRIAKNYHVSLYVMLALEVEFSCGECNWMFRGDCPLKEVFVKLVVIGGTFKSFCKQSVVDLHKFRPNVLIVMVPMSRP